MPTPEEVQAERQKLYETAKLRDDLNDEEAGVLLQWGEQQVERQAARHDPERDYEQRLRFLRKLIFAINRFVGQRQYNDREKMQAYMQRLVPWLAPLGYDNVTEDALWSALPDDPADMMGTLQAMLNVITPPDPPAAEDNPDTLDFGSL